MGKSFYRNNDSFQQREVFLSREASRRAKYEDRSIDARKAEWTQSSAIARENVLYVMKSAQNSAARSIRFTASIHELDLETHEAIFGGRLYEAFPYLEAENDHPILSNRSRQFIEALLAPNGELTDLYLTRGKEYPLLLGYEPSSTDANEISSADVESIRTYVKALLKSLLPPREIEEVIEQALQITTQLKGNVQAIQESIASLVSEGLRATRKKGTKRKSSQGQ